MLSLHREKVVETTADRRTQTDASVACYRYCAKGLCKMGLSYGRLPAFSSDVTAWPETILAGHAALMILRGRGCRPGQRFAIVPDQVAIDRSLKSCTSKPIGPGDFLRRCW